MATTGPRTAAFSVRGPIARADLPGLCDRVCALLREHGPGVLTCDVHGVEPDAVTVDALARLQLAAKRLRCGVRLAHASGELLCLVAFMGLTDVLPGDEFPARRPSQPGTRPHRGETMPRMIFPNLPVEDLNRSVAFFTELGFSFDPRFTDESATAMIVNEHASVMLLVESRFRDFTKKELVDSTKATEAIIAISADSREEVDELVDKALAAGGTRANDPMELGFMYGRSFDDPDGHLWEVFWMDPSALEQGEGVGARAAAS